MERVVANLDRVQPVRVTWNGREYVVAKARMIVPGVLAGSQGALYYDPKDIGLNYQAWNHMPVVINHPRDPSNNHVTARDPKVLEKQGVGYVYNTVFDSAGSGCLDGEAWLDVEKLRKLSPATLAAVEAGRPVEISTGLYTDNLPEDGVDLRSGKRYQFRAVNYRPDHLAILPNEKGACSVQDGCGLNVNQRRGAAVKLTASDVERILANADSCPGCGGDIAQGICTKCGAIIRGNRRLRKNARNASLFAKRADNGCSGMGGGEQSSKIKVTKYPAPRNARGKFATHNQRTPTMRIRTRRDKVKYLTANCSCWKGKEALLANQEAFSDEDLDDLVTNTLVVNGVRGIVANARNEGGENFTGDDDRSDYGDETGVYEANADDPGMTAPDDPDMKKRLMGLMDQYDEHETGEAANLLRALNKSLGKIGAARNSRGRASNARDSQGYGYDNDKEQGAAFARMREDGDLGDPVHENRAHNARARNARDSQGYGYDNDKQQGAAFARMREDGDLGDPVHENRRAARNRATRNQEMTVSEYIANAPPELRPVLANSLRQARELKFDIIERLVANSGLTGDRARSQVEWLSRHDLQSLQRLAALLPPPRRTNPMNDPTLQMFLGAGMGGYPTGNAADQNDVLDIEEARKSYDPALTGNKSKAQ